MKSLDKLSKVGIYVTQNAWTKMDDIVHVSKNLLGFLFHASSGGCNGFNFKLDLLTEDFYKKIKDNKFLTIVTDKESNVYLDPLSELYLLGTTIDYINEDFSNKIYESKFVYNIDKDLMTSCGCGISFSPKIS